MGVEPQGDESKRNLRSHVKESTGKPDDPACPTDLHETAKRCLRCGYVLDRIPEERCPECGQEYDPYDLGTYKGGTLPRERRFPHSVTIAFLSAALLFLLFGGACWLLFRVMDSALSPPPG